jgi:hypothetical protein
VVARCQYLAEGEEQGVVKAAARVTYSLLVMSLVTC